MILCLLLPHNASSAPRSSPPSLQRSVAWQSLNSSATAAVLYCYCTQAPQSVCPGKPSTVSLKKGAPTKPALLKEVQRRLDFIGDACVPVPVRDVRVGRRGVARVARRIQRTGGRVPTCPASLRLSRKVTACGAGAGVVWCGAGTTAAWRSRRRRHRRRRALRTRRACSSRGRARRGRAAPGYAPNSRFPRTTSGTRSCARCRTSRSAGWVSVEYAQRRTTFLLLHRNFRTGVIAKKGYGIHGEN